MSSQPLVRNEDREEGRLVLMQQLKPKQFLITSRREATPDYQRHGMSCNTQAAPRDGAVVSIPKCSAVCYLRVHYGHYPMHQGIQGTFQCPTHLQHIRNFPRIHHFRPWNLRPDSQRSGDKSSKQWLHTVTRDLEEASQQLIFAPKERFANTALGEGFLTYLLHAETSGCPAAIYINQGALPSWDDGMCVAKQCRRPFWKQHSPWQIKTKAPKAGIRRIHAKGSPFRYCPSKDGLCCIVIWLRNQLMSFWSHVLIATRY